MACRESGEWDQYPHTTTSCVKKTPVNGRKSPRRHIDGSGSYRYESIHTFFLYSLWATITKIQLLSVYLLFITSITNGNCAEGLLHFMAQFQFDFLTMLRMLLSRETIQFTMNFILICGQTSVVRLEIWRNKDDTSSEREAKYTTEIRNKTKRSSVQKISRREGKCES